MFIRYLEKPPRFDHLDRWLKMPGVKILDVGCGGKAPFVTKKIYSECKYYGLDKSALVLEGDVPNGGIEEFYKIDLTDIGQLDMIPNDFFDCLILSHVIEHLTNAEDVIVRLLDKLKNRGVIYIESPSAHSVHLPSMRGTLNFYDDPSHVKLYRLEDLASLLINNGCTVVKSGIRHSLKRILLLPLYLMGSLIRLGHIEAGVFWDITGFASYVVALKVSGVGEDL